MPKITRVRSNLKRILDVELDAHHVLIVGDNGAGKTSLLNSIELALTGAVRDIAGRDEIRNTAMLAQLKSDQASARDSLFAEVEFDDGSYARWELSPAGKVKWTKPQHTPLFLYPLVEEALFTAKTLTGGHAKAVRFLYDYFATETFVQVVPMPEVDAMVRDRFVDFVRQHKELPRVERLPAATDTARGAARQFKREAQAFQTAVEALRQYASSNTTAIVELEVLASEAEHARAECEAAAAFGESWMTEIVMAMNAKITEQVSAFLPGGFDFDLVLDETTASVGYLCDQHGRVTPSGAQTVLLAAAVAAAAASHKGGFCVLVTPDRYYSPNTLRALFKLEDVPVTTFIQAGAAPRGRPRAEWQVVDMGAWSYAESV